MTIQSGLQLKLNLASYLLKLTGAARRAGSIVMLLVLVTGCATYQGKVYEARKLISINQPSQAAAQLEPLANEEGKDQLIYLLDYATALQLAGRYKDSARAFERAERIADIQDYHSLSKITSSLLLSEEMVQYKGESFEKVLINGVNAINYVEMGDLDEALVEVRKLNQKLHKYRTEAKRDYDENPYAYYLSGLIWEADRKWDDAYIAYKNAYELAPEYTPLHEDLIRTALKAQRPDELEKWKKEFPEVKVRPEWRDSSMGEIVLLFQQGWGPRKEPRSESPRFPRLVPVGSSTAQAKLVVSSTHAVASQPIFSVEKVAIKTLDDDFARLVATRVAGVAAKAVIADQIRQKNQLLGQLAWIAMNVADRADLRQWSTLPETFQVARIWVKAGKYKVTAQGLDGSGSPTGDAMPERDVDLRAGRKAFVTWRSLR
jgi:hypothetical protein